MDVQIESEMGLRLSMRPNTHVQSAALVDYDACHSRFPVIFRPWLSLSIRPLGMQSVVSKNRAQPSEAIMRRHRQL